MVCSSSQQNVESISLPLESGIGPRTWCGRWTLENQHKQRSEKHFHGGVCPLLLLGNRPPPYEEAQASFPQEERQCREKPHPPSHLNHVSCANSERTWKGSHGRRQSESRVTVEFEWNVRFVKRRRLSPGKRWRMKGQVQSQSDERLRCSCAQLLRISGFRSRTVLVCLGSINTTINWHQRGPTLTHRYVFYWLSITNSETRSTEYSLISLLPLLGSFI